jgi:undecaprenyl-diphosphatase
LDIFQAIIIGIIEGFTEFLPISSTGHMIVVSKFMGIEESALMKAYHVIIQFAAIMAVMLIYREKITFKKIDLWMKLLVAFLPLAIVGFIFKDVIKTLFNVETVAWMFIIGGVVFLVVEYFYTEKEHHIKDVEKVSYTQALWVGIAQIFSLVPGTSRAGATIIGGLLSGLDRKTSTEFSFLLAIPVMATAFIVAYVTIKLFLIFIERFTFVAFGVYRIIFGIILLMVI